MSGTSPEVLLHELGHNFGLEHSDDGKGLMGEFINGQTSLKPDEKANLFKGFNVQAFNKTFTRKNTQQRMKEFFEDNTKSYDAKKAKSTGIE